MKIFFLHSGDRSPSARFRVLPYLAHFRERGHRVKAAASFPQKYDYFPWLGFRPSQLLKKLVRSFHLLQCRLGRYDVAFIDRELFDNPSWRYEAKLRKLVPVFVLDVDDAIFLRYPEKFDRLVGMSDLVVAGNPYLLEKVSPTNSQAVVIPTCVEMKFYPEKDHAKRASKWPIIGWMGTTGNLNYLNVVARPLRRLAQRREFELRLIAPEGTPLEKIDLGGVNVNFIPWNGKTEVEQLRDFDIGLMPLFADNEWDKYKCGLKLIQYMAIGIPGVASPVGVNADIVEHGVDGFLAAGDQEWEDVLCALLEDQSLRRSIGAKARAKVSAKYSIESQYPRLEKSLIETMNRVSTQKRP